MKAHILTSTAAVSIMLGSSVAAAQVSTPTTSEESQTESDTVAEIIVTAQKRTENVQEVPKSVDVVSAAELAIAGVTRLNDLSRVSPSIAGTPSIAGPPPIRGVSSFALSIGVQGQTGAIVDDIPQPQFSALINELSDVERVEVFAGPQSTLSGRNAAGGLINIVTRRPSRTFHATGSLEQTTDHQTRATAFITGPLGPQFAFSLSGFLNDWDGNLRNITLDRRIGGYDTYGVRGKLLWDTGSGVEATLTGYYVKSKTTSAGAIHAGPYVSIAPGAVSSLYPFFVLAQTPSGLFPGITPQPFNREVSSQRISTAETKDRGVNLRVDIDAGSAGTISSLSNYSRSDLPREDNFVAAPTDNPDPFARVSYESKNISQEVRLVSPDGEPLTYTLGGIYSDNDIYHPYARLTFFGNPNWVRETSFASLALFGRATYGFGQSTFVTGGLRYQRDKQRYNWRFLPPGVPTIQEVGGSSKYDFLSGEVSLRHEFTDRINAYVTLSKGETGQAYDLEDSASALAGGLRPLNSEKVNNIEVGLKTQSDDRRITANINFFLAKYSDYQIQTVEQTNDPNAVPAIRIFAIGKVETKGVEFTGGWRATDQLSFNISAAYLDAKIKDYPNAVCYARQQAPDCTNGLQGNLSGRSMPNTPKFKANIAVNYDIPMPSLPFNANVNIFARYQSKANSDLLGAPISNLPGYAIVNLNAGIFDREDKYRLTFFVNNLFDKNYYTDIADDTFLSVPTSPETPMRVGSYGRDSFRYGGVRLNVNF